MYTKISDNSLNHSKENHRRLSRHKAKFRLTTLVLYQHAFTAEMKTALPLLLAVFNTFDTLAFNLATDYYLVYQNPKNDSTLFGLSVILHGGANVNQSWLVCCL